MLAWHFVGATLRDGSPIPADGVTLRHDGPLIMCESGFHASKRLLDALQYAPGNTICRVRLGGKILHEKDKVVAVERTILWRVNGETLLRKFARECALAVAHLWKMPPVVRDYLETGDDAKRVAAWAAARDAAWAAAGDAARAAAGDAARDAARAAAWDAAWDAAWAAQNRRLTAMVRAERRRGA